MSLLRPVSARGPLLAGTVTALVLGTLASLWIQGDGLLYDNDAYYHLAVARLYAAEGIVDDLEAVRFSLLREEFGDKELLFHILLVPFAGAGSADPLAGGRLALALLHGLLAAAVAGLGLRLAGWWALVLPFWLPYASTELAWRLVRLRPELISLLLLLLGVWAMGRGRYRLLGLLAVLYTLSYTAFHAFVGLALLFFVLRWARTRRAEPAAALYPLLGAGLGLLAHPHFPKILQIWLVQNVQFFVAKGSLDVGTEIRPNFTDVVLMVNLGWILGLLCLWQSTLPAETAERSGGGREGALADALGLATATFGLLYLLMSRFVLYLVPLGTLWLLAELVRRKRRLVAYTKVPLAGRLPAALGLVACLLVSFPEARRQLATFRARTAPGPGQVRLADRAAVGATVPAGAHVAAPWRQTPIYMLWAPQGRYLNVLDPVFMATPYPEHHRAWSRVWNGVEPDVPLVLAEILDSELLAYSVVRPNDPLLPRLVADPRIETLYRRFNAVFRVVPDRNRDFLLDWRLPPPGWDRGAVPVSSEVDLGSWAAVPRSATPRGRAVEGYVDLLRRLPDRSRDPDCQLLVSEIDAAEDDRHFELAPSGPTTMWADRELLVSIDTDLGAILGGGVTVELPRGGPRRLTVRTCRSARGELGLYWLRRD